MNYRCPNCSHKLGIAALFFRDISTCTACGQKVVLGDFLAFAMAAVAMLVAALSALVILSHEIEQYYVAAAYAVSIGMASGLAVLFLLGRATPFRGRRVGKPAPQGS